MNNLLISKIYFTKFHIVSGFQKLRTYVESTFLLIRFNKTKFFPCSMKQKAVVNKQNTPPLTQRKIRLESVSMKINAVVAPLLVQITAQ